VPGEAAGDLAKVCLERLAAKSRKAEFANVVGDLIRFHVVASNSDDQAGIARMIRDILDRGLTPEDILVTALGGDKDAVYLAARLS